MRSDPRAAPNEERGCEVSTRSAAGGSWTPPGSSLLLGRGARGRSAPGSRRARMSQQSAGAPWRSAAPSGGGAWEEPGAGERTHVRLRGGGSRRAPSPPGPSAAELLAGPAAAPLPTGGGRHSWGGGNYLGSGLCPPLPEPGLEAPGAGPARLEVGEEPGGSLGHWGSPPPRSSREAHSLPPIRSDSGAAVFAMHRGEIVALILSPTPRRPFPSGGQRALAGKDPGSTLQTRSGPQLPPWLRGNSLTASREASPIPWARRRPRPRSSRIDPRALGPARKSQGRSGAGARLGALDWAGLRCNDRLRAQPGAERLGRGYKFLSHTHCPGWSLAAGISRLQAQHRRLRADAARTCPGARPGPAPRSPRRAISLPQPHRDVTGLSQGRGGRGRAWCAPPAIYALRRNPPPREPKHTCPHARLFNAHCKLGLGPAHGETPPQPAPPDQR